MQANHPTPINADVKKLPRSQKLFYGVGHVLNDLCASCWFSYVLIFMTKVVGLKETNAGIILLIGQVADAISTLIVGSLCDRTKLSWYGKRKFWHAIGTFSVVLSFPFVFNLCLGCSAANSSVQMIYYISFVIIFQFGWASTENSHLTLLPEISTKQSETVELNAIRSGLTFGCGIFVYGVAWILLGSASGSQITKDSSKQFMILSFAVVCVGLLFSFIFHIGTKESKTMRGEDNESNKAKNKKIDIDEDNGVVEPKVVKITHTADSTGQKTWKKWLKTGSLYKCALLYLVTRLGINVFQSYFNLYLTDTLGFQKESIAYFPLIVLVAASVTSVLLKSVMKRIGGQITYTIGATLIIASSVWLYAATKQNRESVYGASCLAGSGSSIILVTALTKIAELIGSNKKSGAFVYSVMGFVDKLSTGVVIFIIQEFKPTPTESGSCNGCSTFLKSVQSIVPGACAFLGLLFILFLFPADHNCCTKDLNPINNEAKIETVYKHQEHKAVDNETLEIADE